ncbi:MAG: hypothetical protein FJ290_07825 [Planctomycetes bacterium]|nr:hypothetical protein [Planctomycetota bacterium]
MRAELPDDALGQRIARVFASEGNAWRSPGGIARMLGLPTHAVEAYLREHSQLFTKSEISPGGTDLYRLREAGLVPEPANS